METRKEMTQGVQRVVVTDVHMGFWSMVVFMVKWAVASIPAAIILAVVVALFWGALSVFAGGVG